MSHIVYKVLYNDSQNKLYSTFVEGDAQKQYKLNVKNHPPKWLKDKGYWLLAFETFTNAYDYKAVMGGTALIIYQAEADKIKRCLPRRLDLCVIKKSTEFAKSILCGWPHGTIMVDGLKLLKEVK